MSSRILLEEMMAAYETAGITPEEFVYQQGVDGFNMDEVVGAYTLFMQLTKGIECIGIDSDNKRITDLETGDDHVFLTFYEETPDILMIKKEVI